MMVRIGLVATVAAFWLGLAWGCESSSESPLPPSSANNGAGTGAWGSGGDGGSADAGTDQDPPSDGGESPLYLGLSANPLAYPPNAADELLAELTTFAAGVRAVVVAERWSDLDPADLSALDGRLATYAARELEVMLTILVVDARADHRPQALGALAWNDAATVMAMTNLLDAVVAVGAGRLRGVVLGKSTDAYLDDNPTEASPFVSFASQALAHLGTVAPTMATGVGVRHVGEAPSALHQSLLALGDHAVFSYLPGAGSTSIAADVSPAKDLDVMIAQAGGRPVMIHAVGFTSAPSLGSSGDTQHNFLASFFGALSPRRVSFDVVNVQQLHDLAPTACAGLALEQGTTPADPWVTYTCSAGLRDASGDPKPAWPALLGAAATFASP